jgi:outer membrane protein assembly factor BamB
VALTALEAADWPQFRGPHFNGIGEVKSGPKLPAGAGSFAWKVELPGRGLSSPIVVGDRVIVTCSSGPQQARLHVICFKVSDGSKLWERQFRATGRTMCHEKTSVAAPTPASDGERIYAFFSSNDLVCLDLEGNLLWLRGLTLDYPNASNSLGMASSLAVGEGTLIVQAENDSESLAAGLDATTGTNRWKLDRPKMANWVSPMLVRAATGNLVAVLQSGKGMTGVEMASGRILWNYTDGASTIASSAVSGSTLLVPSHGLTALRVDAKQEAPTQLWRSGQLRPGTASPAVSGDRVYVLNEAGVLNCGEISTGKRLWQLRLKGPFSSSPVVGGSHLYCINEKGMMQLVDLGKPEGEVVSELNLGETILSTPAMVEGALFVRCDRRLWKIGN